MLQGLGWFSGFLGGTKAYCKPSVAHNLSTLEMDDTSSRELREWQGTAEVSLCKRRCRWEEVYKRIQNRFTVILDQCDLGWAENAIEGGYAS